MATSLNTFHYRDNTLGGSRLNPESLHLTERPIMKVEVEKFKDGRSLKLLVRFEPATNFRPETLTWVPKKEEVEHINEVLLAVDEHNRNQKTNEGGIRP